MMQSLFLPQLIFVEQDKALLIRLYPLDRKIQALNAYRYHTLDIDH
jgi:negative regulator of sigma E activity